MKVSFVSLLHLSAAVLVAGKRGHTALFRWRFDGLSTSQGVNDVTFPINMAKTAKQDGWYFAQQFYVDGVPSISYCGIQPTVLNKNGESIVHGVFSTFQGNSTTSHPNCHQGADGGPGVSCAIDIVGDYDHTWNLTVEVVEDAPLGTLRGTLVDSVTGDSHVIGEFILPATYIGGITSFYGFTEWYPFNAKGDHDCHTMPRTEATFFPPTTNTKGIGKGLIDQPTEAYNIICANDTGNEFHQNDGSWLIKTGWA